MTTPAYIYARYSSVEQGRGHSLKRQLEGARRLIHTKRWEYPGIDPDVDAKHVDLSKGADDRDFKDLGKSAFSGANRQPGGVLHAFEQKAKAGHFRNGAILVVENIDRLTRQGWKEALDLLTDLTSNGVSVAFIQKDRFFPAGEKITMQDAILIVLESELSTEESQKKSDRLTAYWADRIEGIKNGDKKALSVLPPRWIDVDPRSHLMSLNPHRAAVLNEIYSWYADGIGLPKIAQMLNERGERSWAVGKKDKGQGWNTAYLHKLLTNRAVLGEFEPMSRTHGGINETSKGIRVSDYYPQAIAADLFQRCQAQRQTRRRFGGRGTDKLNNLFAGLVHCAHCGAGMYFQSQQKAGRKTNHKLKDGSPSTYVAGTSRSYLLCNNRRRGNQVNLGRDNLGQCPNSGKPRYEHLETAILDTALGLVMDNTSFEMPDSVAEIEAQIAELERAVEGKRFKLSNLHQAIAERFSAGLAGMAGDLEDEIGEDEKRLAQLGKDLDREKGQASPEEHLERVREVRASLDSEDEDIRFAARSRVLQAMRSVLRLRCDKNGVTTVMLANELMAWQFDKNGRLLNTIDNRKRLDLHKGIGSPRIDEVLNRSPKPQRVPVDPSLQQWKHAPTGA